MSADSLRTRFLQSVYQHCYFINRHYSRHSSANNHLIGEAAGVYVACCTWPYWPVMITWREEAFRILNEELEKQTTSEGLNAELSPAYHEFVLEFAIAALLTAEAGNQSMPPGHLRLVGEMAECLRLLRDQFGNMPMFGDADEGHVFRLSHSPEFDPLLSLCDLGQLAAGHVNAGNQCYDEQSAWLGMNNGDSANVAEPPGQRIAQETALYDAGYFLIGNHFGADDEIRIWMDAGRLGYLSIAAHGHADALSLYLAAFGEEILIDPGTFAYHTDKKWRAYFRGTSAHNTVRIDRQDQSLSGGNFMWLKHASAKLEKFEFDDKAGVIAASHDGYKRLDDPVSHFRRARIDKATNEVLVEDTIDCAGEHLVELYWHFAEQIRVESGQEQRQFRAIGQKATASFATDVVGDSGITEYLVGQDTPPLGWVSRKFGEKVPTTTVRYSLPVNGSVTIRTRISLSPSERPSQVIQ